MLDFRAFTLEDKPTVDRYFCRYGENSCQHAFVSLYCMESKYGDRFCERDGYLYILRCARCNAKERVYLFPMGAPDGLRQAVSALRLDAHAHGKRLCFETLTRRAAEVLQSLFPGAFSVEPSRDYAEYIYTYEKLAYLPGPEMASKRHDINTFYRDYGNRFRVELLCSAHIDAVLAFQERWLKMKMQNGEDVQLECEDAAIRRGLAQFEDLGLSGIAVYIDEHLAGYAYGAPLSDTCYDVMIEKGDRRFPDIYRVLNRDLVRLCCAGYALINREEDVGAPGLRKAKLSYKPDFLLEKFVAREVPADE